MTTTTNCPRCAELETRIAELEAKLTRPGSKPDPAITNPRALYMREYRKRKQQNKMQIAKIALDVTSSSCNNAPAVETVITTSAAIDNQAGQLETVSLWPSQRGAGRASLKP